MLFRKFILFLLFGFIVSSCTKKLKTNAISSPSEVDEVATVRSDKREECNCLDPNNYAPDARYPEYQDTKYIRLNFHYPNASNLKYNYTGEDAVRYSKDLVHNANRKMNKNQKMNLPVGNDTPVYPTGYQYIIAEDPSTESGLAVYVDVDDENWDYIKKGKGKNNYSKVIIKKFAQDADSILNVFAMAYSPDSLKVKGFKGGSAGIALGTSLKIAGIKAEGISSGWKFATLMNHEIGHVFGLRHSWYKNDGCDDTPPNPNCWGQTEEGKCAGVISNNLMDYNNQQMAITPCQIGVVHKTMHKHNNKKRALVLKDWCDYDPNKTLVVKEDLNLDRAVDMKGDIIVMEDVTLRLSCRVHMPKGGKIIIHPGAKLFVNGAHIHNDCGEEWGGFEVLSKGKKTGTIEYAGEIRLHNMEEHESPSGDSE